MLLTVMLWTPAINASEGAIPLHELLVQPTSSQSEKSTPPGKPQPRSSGSGKPIHTRHWKDKPVRATWIATVQNMDWPSKASLALQDRAERIEVQQAELRTILDKVVELGMNTVIFQVKPCADALYRSTLLPWSATLTGSLGEDPGFDPLAYAIEEAHARGMQLHAWLNPYRVSMNLEPETLQALLACSTTVYRQHPEWIRTAYHRYVLDPGIPAVRTWIEQIIEEIVERYNIDGIQFDDYFYYESRDSTLADDQSYSRYGKEFTNKADWRRHNTYTLIKAVSKKIKAVKPQVKFGISPSGVWRNKKDDPNGSNTDSFNPHYDTAYADTRQWVQETLIDYIVPQIYWSHALEIAPYEAIATWWADLVKSTQTQLYIGMALYKVGEVFHYQVAGKTVIDPSWSVAEGILEIKRQLDLNEKTPGIHGSMLFRSLNLLDPQKQPVVNYIKSRWQGTAIPACSQKIVE
jgi:uncharacterized lipoprotein YddW (UPF0748 family)